MRAIWLAPLMLACGDEPQSPPPVHPAPVAYLWRCTDTSTCCVGRSCVTTTEAGSECAATRAEAETAESRQCSVGCPCVASCPDYTRECTP